MQIKEIKKFMIEKYIRETSLKDVTAKTNNKIYYIKISIEAIY